MSGNGNQVPLAPSQRGPAPYPRASTPHRPECYLPTTAAGAGYMPSTAGAQSSAQSTLRGQPTQQQAAPPTQQQDLSKNSMAGHSYASQQNQNPQARAQYPNFQYRGSQHGNRPNSHPRQQQQYIPGATATPTGPVMYHPTLLFQPTPMGIPQTYQQPRSSTQGYYPYVAPYIGYSTPPSHTPPYTRPPKRHVHRVPIIHPVTHQDIFLDLYSNENQLNNDLGERQTPQPEPTHNVAKEFSRMVNEVANQPTVCESALKPNYEKIVDLPISSTPITVQPQTNAINSININVVKSEILTVNENKSLGPDVAVETNETPVVSAISDSPVIVPKMPKIQKNSDQNVQSLVLDTIINVPLNKNHKQNKSKPVVPQVEEVMENATDSVSPGVSQFTSNVANPPLAFEVPVGPPAAASLPPQPQRIKEPRERNKPDEKDKPKENQQDNEIQSTHTSNGPTHPVEISSVDSLTELINPSTSVNSQEIDAESLRNQVTKLLSLNLETDKTVIPDKIEIIHETEPATIDSLPTATELLSASIEKLAKELPEKSEDLSENKEASSAIQAQAKLTQSIASCIRSSQSDLKMKDINLNKTTDPDTANGNTTDITTKTETFKEDINKNEKAVKNSKNNSKKLGSKMANSDSNVKGTESQENGKDETDKVSNIEQEKLQPTTDESLEKSADVEEEVDTSTANVFVPKYNYIAGQWSPLNKAGKKCYDIQLLKQIKDDPLSKNKPNAPLLEACNIIRTAPMQEPTIFTPISRPVNDTLFPNFFQKSSGVVPRNNNTPRDVKKDGRNMIPSGKGSVKLGQSPSGSCTHKPVIHVSLSLREEVQLSKTEFAWKPSRLKRSNMTEDDYKTQDLYNRFRGILNKLTPQKFSTLLDRVKTLEIDNQRRLEGVIDLVFEKAIDEPNFSEAYAAMCCKLSTLKVPVDNATSPDQCVNFRGLIINKCQNQFVTEKVDEQILSIEKEIYDCTDSTKKRELQIQLEEENRRVRMRSVGNVRFIGELYKLKMLTAKIMVFCMNHLTDKLEEEKLECLCKLLTTIGQQVESEVKEHIEAVFKKMQDIVDKKTNKISSRVRFMIQDVIELRRRRWTIKSVVDSQPKMMDQIQKEAEQQQRHIELMNSNPVTNFRRDEGGRGRRGDNRRQNSNSFMDNNWKTHRSSYVVDMSKLKAVNTQKNLSSIKLAPSQAWSHGSGTKHTAQAASNSMIGLSSTAIVHNNTYSVLENVQTDPTSLRGNKDMTPSYHAKGASIERSTFNSRADFGSGPGSRSGSVTVPRSNSGSRSTSATPTAPPVTNEVAALKYLAQIPLPEDKKKFVKASIELYLINLYYEELVADFKLLELQYHAAVVTEIIFTAIEKSPIKIAIIAKALLHLVSTNTISAENFLAGLAEIFECAPDLYIDLPKLYDYLGTLCAPQIEKKYITLVQVFRLCDAVLAVNHGHMVLKGLLNQLKDSMGPSFVKSKWQESGLQINEWMSEEQVPKWIEDNMFEFLEGGNSKTCEETKKILTPAETQSKLCQLMNSDESCECIMGWVQDNLGKSSNEDWFMRALIQAICEHALFGPEGRDVPHFNQDRITKYCGLINDYGETREAREANCLFGIQQFVHRFEHPQGLTLEIFQYLHEQYIISVEGFLAWEISDKELEGKAVMLKALTSFFTNIKEADNEDSCSED